MTQLPDTHGDGVFREWAGVWLDLHQQIADWLEEQQEQDEERDDEYEREAMIRILAQVLEATRGSCDDLVAHIPDL